MWISYINLISLDLYLKALSRDCDFVTIYKVLVYKKLWPKFKIRKSKYPLKFKTEY